jgi:hypothetical protein
MEADPARLIKATIASGKPDPARARVRLASSCLAASRRAVRRVRRWSFNPVLTEWCVKPAVQVPLRPPTAATYDAWSEWHLLLPGREGANRLPPTSCHKTPVAAATYDRKVFPPMVRSRTKLGFTVIKLAAR